jgi:hypothetical protein
MPNYVAHEIFGRDVCCHLPSELQEAVAVEPEIFRSGLYGPDPLLFVPGGLTFSRFLHHTWQQSSAPALQEMIQWGTQEERSFAAGYLCHLIFDDFCHPWIYRWMAENGLSHRALEVGLDWMILDASGCGSFPSPRVAERKRITQAAVKVFSPAGARTYGFGLASMAFCCSQMTAVGKLYRRKLGAAYQGPLEELQKLFQEAVDSATMLITLFAAGVMQPATAGLLLPAAA